MPKLRSILAGCALTLAAATAVSCGGSLKLKLLNSSARKPSNVAMYFTVDTSDGKPVPGLTSEKFTIYEDGEKVSEFESKQTILNPKIAAAHYTLLLIDMSGSITEAKKTPDVVNAASKFMAKVEKQQKVGVGAFDGSTEVYGIVPFTDNPDAAKSGLDKLLTFKAKDPSTNLNGAVVEGLKTLKKALDADPKPIKVGTLVVFTDGTDRANRVSKKELDDQLKAKEYSEFDIFAIGVGAEIKNSKLEDIGRSGTVKEQDDAKMEAAFDQIATKIEGLSQRYYLLSYCTPSRKGEHEVTVEAHGKDSSGKLSYKFSADDMGPNCDPNTPPDFDMSHPVEPKTDKSGGAAKGK